MFQLLKVSKILLNDLALTKLPNPHKLWHGFQELMNIFIPSYLYFGILEFSLKIKFTKNNCNIRNHGLIYII